jgi:hypothetical protein
MMSDEEEVDGKFKVYRQEWRSAEFNNFMDTLDSRASSSKSVHPRMERSHGTPFKGDPPADVATWTVSNNDDSGIILAPQTPEISF